MGPGRAIAMTGGAALLLAMTGCGNGPPAAGGSSPTASVGTGGTKLGIATEKSVGNDQDQFAPTATTAKVGDIIEWTNSGSHVHNVTFDDYQSMSGQLGPGDVWQVKFSTAGNYDYHCTYHPQMTAKLTITQ